MWEIFLWGSVVIVVCVVVLAWALCSASARAEEAAAMMWSNDGTPEAIERCYLCGTSLGWKPETLVDTKATCKKCATILEEGKCEDTGSAETS